MIWARHSTANLVIKTLKDKEPRQLHNVINRTLYYEKRRPMVPKFYNGSSNKGGFQRIRNRLAKTFNDFGIRFDLKESNDAIRRKLKVGCGSIKPSYFQDVPRDTNAGDDPVEGLHDTNGSTNLHNTNETTNLHDTNVPRDNMNEC
jgi:hypothetical protein